jgi:hypothetical protein
VPLETTVPLVDPDVYVPLCAVPLALDPLGAPLGEPATTTPLETTVPLVTPAVATPLVLEPLAEPALACPLPPAPLPPVEVPAVEAPLAPAPLAVPAVDAEPLVALDPLDEVLPEPAPLLPEDDVVSVEPPQATSAGVASDRRAARRKARATVEGLMVGSV